MPRNYGEGRSCEQCGKPLQGHQATFCSCRCANLGRLHMCTPHTVVAAKMPTNDEIWAERGHLTRGDWARHARINPSTLSNRMTKRGWRFVSKSAEITHAPCKECGASTPVQEMGEKRVCKACKTGRVIRATPSVVQRERRRRKPGGDRWTHMWRTTRPYTFFRGQLVRKRADHGRAA